MKPHTPLYGRPEAFSTTFDVRSDMRPGKRRDPDRDSPTLKRYHRYLWAKVLESGEPFDLDDSDRAHYLLHRSALGTFSLTSDSVIATYTRYGFAAEFPDLCGRDDSEAFFNLAYTPGGFMVFPGQKRSGSQTINQARGCRPRIRDRMDLTLECIRRHYTGESHPLAKVLAPERDFFSVFRDFGGYVRFFLLQDLVSADYSRVEFFMPFRDFAPPAVPQDLETYLEYRRRSVEFIKARNARMEQYAASPV